MLKLLRYWLILSVWIIAAVNSYAQDFAADAAAQTDSILATRGIFPGKEGERWRDEKIMLYDTVYWQLIHQQVAQVVGEGAYWYPEGYLSPFGEGTSKVPTPSGTGWKWLAFRYHITGSQLRDGCIYHSSYRDFDSVMNLRIEQAYGADIFIRAHAEADSLEKSGLGLKPPFIVDSAATLKILARSFDFVQNLPSEDTFLQETRALKFSFKNGRVADVRVCHYRLGLQEDLSLSDQSEKLTKIAQKLPWHPPLFLGKPYDGSFVWYLKLNIAELY